MNKIKLMPYEPPPSSRWTDDPGRDPCWGNQHASQKPPSFASSLPQEEPNFSRPDEYQSPTVISLIEENKLSALEIQVLKKKIQELTAREEPAREQRLEARVREL